MTSRQEGFPMVLIEAMLRACVAMTVLVDQEQLNTEKTVLVQDGNEDDFVEKLNRLIEEVDLKVGGSKAAESVSQYDSYYEQME
jgi:glycosyltransferase involved in cell wall biosynthesis